MIIPVKLRNFWKSSREIVKFDPYLWFLLCLIALFFGLEFIHHFNPLAISPFESIMRLAGRDVLFSVTCLSGAIAVLCVLPIDIRERLCLVGSCFICEIVYMQWNWGAYSLIGHLALLGPISMLFCLIILIVYLVRFALLDKITAWVVVDIMSFAVAMPLLYAIYSSFSQDSAIYDLLLLKADSLWGFQPSFLFTRLLKCHVLVVTLMLSVYFYLPLWMMGAQIVCYTRDYSNKFIPIVRTPGIPAFTFVAVAVFGILGNYYLPAVGPSELFDSSVFPFGICPEIPLRSCKPLYSSALAGRSCIPCLGLTFVLCAYYTLYNIQPFWRHGWFILSILTAASAFSIGGHWATDLLVVPPFAAFCLGLTWHRVPGKKRWLITGACGLATFLMLWLLKTHLSWCVAHPALYWLLWIIIDTSAIAGINYMRELARVHEYELAQSRQPYRFGRVPKEDEEEEER
ncbi:MAG: hypothetical protein Q4F00_12380 [bacterium]|nr:hypothetical protein [bacterium]